MSPTSKRSPAGRTGGDQDGPRRLRRPRRGAARRSRRSARLRRPLSRRRRPGPGRGAGRDASRAVRAGGALAVRPGCGLAGRGDRAARRHLCRGDRAGAGSGRRASACRQTAGLRLADELGVVGVLAVELFETVDGALLVNELAMRPHNSGHWTMDGPRTSQFEQHLRAVLDYPLGDTARSRRSR